MDFDKKRPGALKVEYLFHEGQALAEEVQDGRQMRTHFSIVAAIAVGCGGDPSSPPVAATQPDGPCDLVAAMLSIDNLHYQDFYAGKSCGDPLNPMVVDVRSRPSLIPPNTQCSGYRFQLYHGEPIDRLILRLDLVADGARWQFIATRFQPVPREAAGGGFDAADSYCFVKGGFVELQQGRWRTSYDLQRALHAGK